MIVRKKKKILEMLDVNVEFGHIIEAGSESGKTIKTDLTSEQRIEYLNDFLEDLLFQTKPQARQREMILTEQALQEIMNLADLNHKGQLKLI